MSNDNQPSPTTRFFFPLRTNVGFFDTPEGESFLIERIKQASLLYDELIFEPGVYMAYVGEDNNNEIHLQEDSEEMLALLRSGFKPTGSKMQFMLQPEGGEARVIFGGPSVRQFHCEFHSALRGLGAEKLPWIKMESYELTDQGKNTAKGLFNVFDSHLNEIDPNIHRHLKRRILSNFSRDLTIASAMQISTSMNMMYAPVLHQIALLSEAEGFRSLQVAVPDLSHVGWDVILDLRNEPSLVSFRHMLFSLERDIQSLPNTGDVDQVKRQYAITQAYLEEWSRVVAELRPKKLEAIGEAILDIFLGFQSIPILSTCINFIRGLEKLERDNQSWYAAVQKLRPPE